MNRECLLHVQLCEYCAQRLGLLVETPSYHEGLRLREIARELAACATCARYAGELVSAANRWEAERCAPLAALQEAWAWVERV